MAPWNTGVPLGGMPQRTKAFGKDKWSGAASAPYTTVLMRRKRLLLVIRSLFPPPAENHEQQRAQRGAHLPAQPDFHSCRTEGGISRGLLSGAEIQGSDAVHGVGVAISQESAP